MFGTLETADAETSQNIWITVSVSADIHNVTQDIWYNTIMEAVTDASNNNIIEKRAARTTPYIQIDTKKQYKRQYFTKSNT